MESYLESKCPAENSKLCVPSLNNHFLEKKYFIASTKISKLFIRIKLNMIVKFENKSYWCTMFAPSYNLL